MKIPKVLDIDQILDMYEGLEDAVAEKLVDLKVPFDEPAPRRSQHLAGVVEFDEESGCPILSEDMSDWEEVQVGVAHHTFGAWANYFEGKLSQEETRFAIIEDQLAVVKAALEHYYRTEQGAAADVAKNLVLVDERYVNFDLKFAESRMVRGSLKRSWEKMKRAANTLSRELTRRKSEAERQMNHAPPLGPAPTYRGRGR